MTNTNKTPEQIAYEALVLAAETHGEASAEFLAAHKALKIARAARAAANPQGAYCKIIVSGP